LRPALTLPGTAARTILAAAILALLWPLAITVHRDTGSPSTTRPAHAVAEAGNGPADTWT
jgi:hypothetical protein